MSTTNILVLPKLSVLKANARASAYSVGFPAMTAWAGFVHALERQLNEKGFKVKLPRFGVVTYDLNVSRRKEKGDTLYSLTDQSNPLKSDGKPQSTVESATCNMEVTVLAEIEGDFEESEVTECIQLLLKSRLRCCSGMIIANHQPWLKNIETESDWYWLRRTLMPGQIIVSRHDLLSEEMEQTQDCFEALLNVVGVINRPIETENEEFTQWIRERKHPGWLVPIAVGFYGISELKQPHEILHARDTSIQHRFVESLVSLCEFTLSYRIESVSDALWSTRYDNKNGLYVIEQ